jgi:hypothetical protein
MLSADACPCWRPSSRARNWASRRVDVRLIVDAVRIVVDLDRVQKLGADLRRQRKMRREDLDREREREARDDRDGRAAQPLAEPSPASDETPLGEHEHRVMATDRRDRHDRNT